MKKALTTTEAVFLICGSGLGTGILAVPYFVARTGLVQTILAVVVACVISMMLHLIVADLALCSKDSTQLLGIFEEHLFRGRLKSLLSTVFFIVLAVLLLFNLTLYIVCAADIVSATFGLPMYAAKLIFYVLASLIVAFGIKPIGIGEKYSMMIIGGTILALGILSFGRMEYTLPGIVWEDSGAVALYAMCMFSFSALFAVPQVVTYTEDKGKIRLCILLGIGCNALLTLVFSLIVNFACAEVTTVATLGLSLEFGPAAAIICTILVSLAMFTSFLSIALAQIDILREKLRLGYMPAWLAATVPTLLMALLLPLGFLSYIEIVGGIVAIIVAMMILPAYRHAIKGQRSRLLLGRAGRSFALVLIVLAFYLLMAAGSLIPIG